MAATINFEYDFDFLSVQERVIHIPQMMVERDVRVGTHGVGGDFEEDVETVSYELADVPICYTATLLYDSCPVLTYSCIADGYAEYLGEIADHDMKCDDMDFLEWLFGSRKANATLLECVLAGDVESAIENYGETASFEDVFEHDKHDAMFGIQKYDEGDDSFWAF